MNKIKKLLFAAIVSSIVIVASAFPAFAADATLAVSPKFNSTFYAMLNPVSAQASGYDITQMYNHYMTTGVKQGERIYATAIPTTGEYLFKYMSYNRSLYLKEGLNPAFPFFNVNNYIIQNKDLVPIFGTNLQLYLLHYVNYGIYEGRSSGTVFDPARAIEFNVALCQLNNAKLEPYAIFNNFVAGTGMLTTAGLAVTVNSLGEPVATLNIPKPQPVVVCYTSCNNNSSSGSGSGQCAHDWYYKNFTTHHQPVCTKCGKEGDPEDHHFTLNNGALSCFRCGQLESSLELDTKILEDSRK